MNFLPKTTLEPWKQTSSRRYIRRPTQTTFGKSLFWQTFQNPTTHRYHDFLHFDEGPSAMVFALTDGRVIVNEEAKTARRTVEFELPCGSIQDDETPEAAIRRELLEESGYETRNLIDLGYLFISGTNIPSKTHLFLAPNCYKSAKPKRDSTEVIITHLIHLQRWKDAVFAGEINCSSSVTCTVRALGKLGCVKNLLVPQYPKEGN